MQFTNAEVMFLSQGRSSRGLNWSEIDFGVKSSCPPHIMQRIFEARAKTLGADFALAQGIAFVAQPAQSLTAAGCAIPTDPWRLGAVHAVTTLTGSALLAIALARGELSVDAAWAAAHVDEDWNMELWGRDQLALERRAARFAEMQAAATVLEAA